LAAEEPRDLTQPTNRAATERHLLSLDLVQTVAVAAAQTQRLVATAGQVAVLAVPTTPQAEPQRLVKVATVA
jgi:hypothetical protein